MAAAVKNGPAKTTSQVEDEILAVIERKLHRQQENEMMVIYLLVCVAMTTVWLLGLYQISFLFVFVIMTLIFIVWRGKVLRLTESLIRRRESIVQRKRALQYSETAEWLNFAINRWWSFSALSISDIVKKHFNALLVENKPSYIDKIELLSFCVGEQTPCVKHVDIYECVDGIGGGKRPVRWSSVLQPPAGLQQLSQYQLVLDANVELTSREFSLILRSRLGGKWLGMCVDVAVENLHLCGQLQLIVKFDMNVTFPHISTITASFTRRPDVWFGVRVLKAVQLMEIPLLKSWIQHIVMDGIIEALIDPGKFDINLTTLRPNIVSNKPETKARAAGVLTVVLNGEYLDVKDKDKAKASRSNVLSSCVDDLRRCEVSLGEQKVSTNTNSGLCPFNEAASFLVYNMKTDVLTVKLTSNVFLSTQTLAQFEVPLSTVKFDHKQSCQLTLLRPVDKSVGGNSVRLTLSLKFHQLANIEQTFAGETSTQPCEADIVSGVVHVVIHGASNLLPLDAVNLSNPYCVLFNSGIKVKTSHFVPKTTNPKWDLNAEFIVSDISETVLSCFVYNFDGRNTNEDTYLGSATLTLSADEPTKLRQSINLSATILGESCLIGQQQLGSITVSAVYRPVPAVAIAKTLSMSHPWFEVAHQQTKNIATDCHLSDGISTSMSTNGIVELNIIAAKDLVAKDRNGFSDPFCEVRVNGQRKYLTSVKKKTLTPNWNECTTVDLPTSSETLEIIVWDHDVILRNDFLGSVTLTRTELLSVGSNAQHDGWFKLSQVKSGFIQIKITVFSCDLPLADSVDDHSSVFEDQLVTDKAVKQSKSALESVKRTNSKDHTSERFVTSSTGDDTLTLSSADVTFINNSLQQEQQQELMEITKATNNSAAAAAGAGGEAGAGGGAGGGSQKLLRKSPNKTTPVRRVASDAVINTTQNSDNSHSSAAGTLPKSLSATGVLSMEQFYGVKGTLKTIKGLPETVSSIYCKIRLVSHGDRMSTKKPLSGRVLAKSAVYLPTPRLAVDVQFEVVDRKFGVSKDALLVFDIKSHHYSHVAVRAFTLQELFTEGEKECTKWLPLDLGVEVKVELSYEELRVDEAAGRRRSHSFLGSLRAHKLKKIKEN